MNRRLLAAASILIGIHTAAGQIVTNTQTLSNPTAANSSTAQSSPQLILCGQGWEGNSPANTQVCLTLQNVISNGPNGNGYLTVTGSNSTGSYALAAPSFVAQGSSAAGALSLENGATGPIYVPPNSFTLVGPPTISNAFEVITPAAPTAGFWLGTEGTGATATAVVTGGTHQITSYNITANGSGYTTNPICTVTATAGSGATCSTTINPVSGQVNGVNYVTYGSGYTGTTTVTISPQLTLSAIGVGGQATGTNTVQMTSSTSTTSGDVVTYDGTGNVQDSGNLLSTYATLASPTFTGVPAAPTPASTDNSTKLATTAFVKSAIYGAWGGYTPANVNAVNSFAQWTTPAAITVTGFDLDAGVAATGSCSPAGTFSVYDQTASAIVLSIPIVVGTNAYSTTGTVNVSSGHVLRMRVTTASSGCSLNAAQLMSTVTYQMQ